MMKILVLSVILLSSLFSNDWTIKRNPFVVSKNYMERTGKHYLVPKDTYAFLNISVKGIFHKKGQKLALLDLDDKGFIYIKEGETIEIDTADIKSSLKAVKIEQNYLLLSINEGEAIRHEIK